MMTWLRGARCTDPEAMPEMEARPPAKNRHGGAPRGERPASWDAPHPAGCGSVAPHPRDNRTSAPVGAPPAPRSGMDANIKDTTRAQERAAGTKKTALFDIVRWRKSRLPSLSCPGRAERDPGPRGDTMDRASRVLRWIPGLVPLAQVARCTRPGHEIGVTPRPRAGGHGNARRPPACRRRPRSAASSWSS